MIGKQLLQNSEHVSVGHPGAKITSSWMVAVLAWIGVDGTGGGGAAADGSNSYSGGEGGSGIVMIRYQFQ